MEVVPMGTYKYIVEGEHETIAASDLEDRVDMVSRCYHRSEEEHIMALADARASVERAYGVTVKIKIV